MFKILENSKINVIWDIAWAPIKTKEDKLAHKERTDSCSVPAASIVAESMLCFVLADALLEKFGGDTMEQMKAHMNISGKY